MRKRHQLRVAHVQLTGCHVQCLCRSISSSTLFSSYALLIMLRVKNVHVNIAGPN